MQMPRPPSWPQILKANFGSKYGSQLKSDWRVCFRSIYHVPRPLSALALGKRLSFLCAGIKRLVACVCIYLDIYIYNTYIYIYPQIFIIIYIFYPCMYPNINICTYLLNCSSALYLHSQRLQLGGSKTKWPSAAVAWYDHPGEDHHDPSARNCASSHLELPNVWKLETTRVPVFQIRHRWYSNDEKSVQVFRVYIVIHFRRRKKPTNSIHTNLFALFFTINRLVNKKSASPTSWNIAIPYSQKHPIRSGSNPSKQSSKIQLFGLRLGG